MSNRPRIQRFPFVAGAYLVFIGALGVALSAWVGSANVCDEATSETCTREGLATLQFVVAIAGLPLAGAALYVALFARYRAATICLLSALPLYVAWAILVDAVVHGWDDLILLP